MPNYTAKKSVVASLNVWLIVFFWLIVPLIILIVRILSAKSYSLEFYDEKMVCKYGLLNKNEDESVFFGVYSVKVYQSFLGRIFNYGDVYVDCPGSWDVNTEGVKNPQGLKKFLQTKITTKNATNIIHN